MDKDEYIVMLPFMAHGHLIPCLSLAAQILRSTSAAADSLTVIIATTELNIRYLKPQTPPSLAGNILFSELQLPTVENLPPNTQSTEDLDSSQMSAFLHASLSLEYPTRDLLRSLAAERGGRVPLCVISDVFYGWAVRVAAEFRAVHATLTTCGAYGTAAYVSLWLNLPHRRRGAGEDFAVPGFPERCRFSLSQLHPYLRSADGTDDWSRFFQKVIALSMESHCWLCCTVEEVEPLGVEVLRNYLNAPVFCVGKLPLPSTSSQGKKYGVSPEECVTWLDSQPPKSVVFISFGSQNTVGPQEMMALAVGLEESRKPFIWAIRPPLGADPKAELRPEWLPENFEERMRESKRGLLVRKWAPQVDILAHGATGAFLSHCGWNSVVEALGEGVPLIGWPLAAEQAYNVKMLVEEKGVCVELARGATCRVGPEEVRKAVEAVVGDVEMRRRAEEVARQLRAAVAEGGSVDRHVREFLDSVITKRDQMTVSNTNGSHRVVE